MKAAVCYAFGQPLVVEEIEIDPPEAGEVCVRMTAVAICHSDLHIVRGDWGGDLPVVVGHEGAGIVDLVGPGVTQVREGDPVVVSLLRACGRCESCTTGLPHLCSGTFAIGTESRLRTLHGQTIRQGMNTAAFAEYAIVDQSQLARVPETLPARVAALLACGVITGYGAVVNRARVKPGSSVVVIGAGGVGMNAIQGARLSGARTIVAVDIRPEKLAAAEAFGATHGILAGENDVKAALKALTEDRLADYVFVTVGSTAAAEQAFALARRRGTVVFVGVPDWKTRIEIPIGLTILSEKTITGSFMGTTRLSEDIPFLVDLYQKGRLKLDELISECYTLERINEALEATESGLALRNVILF